MTSLATEANVNIILRELQSYMLHQDKAFVTAAIHALGRCAINVPDVAEKCLTGLMRLINDQNGELAQRKAKDCSGRLTTLLPRCKWRRTRRDDCG